MHDFRCQNTMKNKSNSHPRASSLFITVHQSLLLGIEENVAALQVYSSFVRVATTGLRIIPYSLVVVVVCAQMRSYFGTIPFSLQHGIVRIVLVTSTD